MAWVRIPRWSAPLCVALIWGVNVPVMKGALGSITPFAFNAMRLTLSAVALGLADRFEARERAPARIPWREILHLALLTSIIYQVLFIAGIARTSASHTGFLIASGPLWTAIFARFLGMEQLRPRAWIGLGLAFFGTALVASTTVGPRSATLLGNVLLLLAMLAWAFGTVRSRSVLEEFSPTRLAFLTTLIALPGHWIIAATEHGAAWWNNMKGGTWAAIAYSGIFSTGLAYILWNWSVRRLGPSRTSAYTNLVPVCTIAVAWTFLEERPSALQIFGGGLILLGLAVWRARRPEAIPRKLSSVPSDAIRHGCGADVPHEP